MAKSIIENPVQDHSPLTEANFAAFYESYRDRLCARLLFLTRNREAAEDATADAFARACKNRESFRGQASAYTWLCTIAFRVAVRKRLSQEVPLDTATLESLRFEERLDDDFEFSQVRQELKQALGRISPKCRQVLVDHFMDGRPVGEIAKRLRIPPGTVLSRLFNGKRHLRKAWEAT